ncbi:short chain dehydrogenase [Pseudoalteromonas sp. MMG005]|uniref:short chain dehydrogenase n=1 Tax=Pseudoalteromonas sp. MMG005 TaxID=2822682 RepID=UPI001B3A68E8|nr:short chain dehydrogenase [Pseudoalteromonas sp. MMG005]MBQ4848419.1 short chain dehydrogenase [Pseudoalteromonas sp. MMG005]
MKILLIGGTGLIGKSVAKYLETSNELIAAGYTDGDVRVDLGSKVSIQSMFKHVGNVDAVVCTAGVANFGAFDQLPDDEYELALSNKLMGQVNLVRFGRNYINVGGSVTLTSGILSREPMRGSVAVSMVNGALESFVKAAALELEEIRLNIVSPIFVKETMAMMGMDTDAGLSASDTAKAYVSAVEGSMHGTTLNTPDYI